MDLRSNVGEQMIPEPASVSFQPGLDDQFGIHTYCSNHVSLLMGKGIAKKRRSRKTGSSCDLCQARSGDLECIRLT